MKTGSDNASKMLQLFAPGDLIVVDDKSLMRIPTFKGRVSILDRFCGVAMVLSTSFVTNDWDTTAMGILEPNSTWWLHVLTQHGLGWLWIGHTDMEKDLHPKHRINRL